MFGQRQASDSTSLHANSLPNIATCISTSPLITAHRLQNYCMLFLQSSNEFPPPSIADTCQHSRVISVCSHEAQEILFTLNLDLAEFCSDKLHDKIDFRANCSKPRLKGFQLYQREEGSLQQNSFILKKIKKTSKK